MDAPTPPASPHRWIQAKSCRHRVADSGRLRGSLRDCHSHNPRQRAPYYGPNLHDDDHYCTCNNVNGCTVRVVQEPRRRTLAQP